MSAIASCLTLHIVWHMVVIRLLRLTSIVSRCLMNWRKSIQNVFSEPTYPIWEHREPFKILLIDTSK